MEQFAIAQKVRVKTVPPYLKTADPMPMLRPPNLICLGEEGIILDIRPGGYFALRFAKGNFLMDSQYLEAINN